MTVTRRRARSRRGSGDQLGDEIVTATTQLLVEGCTAAEVSIRAVAARVGVSAPAIYLHFADKRSLLDAVVARYFERLDEVMLHAVGDRAGVAERAHALGMAYVRLAVETPELYRLATMDIGTDRSPVDTVFYSSACAHFSRMLSEILSDTVLGDAFLDSAAEAGGADTGGDPGAAVLEVWSVTHGVASLMIAKPYLSWGSDFDTADRLLRTTILGAVVVGLLGGDPTIATIDDWIAASQSAAPAR